MRLIFLEFGNSLLDFFIFEVRNLNQLHWRIYSPNNLKKYKKWEELLNLEKRGK
ncbi:hypothetical protein SAMN05216556_11925 [Aequorivita viscosa]|uniref:Uncharacterized protein n=1 Tax=Aequorivita viscosa TaxID=797419 RepID=A0A1M6JS98_9FLAO|nr:hypothetical protein SAMN05216556_11925 [Aequorivita viscosa]SHJ49614.1 hypothetical protein SAMN04487908_11823 [Aequorivita viscosa]